MRLRVSPGRKVHFGARELGCVSSGPENARVAREPGCVSSSPKMWILEPGVLDAFCPGPRSERTLPKMGSLISRGSFPILFFSKTSCFPWGSDGILERRIPGKNGHGSAP